MTVIETYTKTGQIFSIYLVNRSCQEAKLIYLPGSPASDISNQEVKTNKQKDLLVKTACEKCQGKNETMMNPAEI